MTERDVEVTTVIDGNHVVRSVTEWYEGGAAWRRHVIMPRELVNLKIRKVKARNKAIMAGLRKGWLESVPDALGCFHKSIVSEGSGRWFARSPWICKKNRRFIVMTQSGGMDI